MFDQFFGKYLLEKKCVSLSLLQNLLKRLDQARIRLGVLAIHERLMNAEQVEYILKLQQKEDLCFGELAIREGLLKESDLKDLLEIQKQACFSLGQLLVDDGILTFDQLEKLFHDYRRDSGLTRDEIRALSRNDLNGVLSSFFQIHGDSFDMYREYVRLFLKSVVRFVSPNIRFGKMETVADLPYENILSQKIGGPFGNVAFGLCGSAPDLVEFARLFSPIASLELDDMAKDAIGEFLNIQNGLYLSQLSEKGLELQIAPPEYARGGVLKGHVALRTPLSLPIGNYDIAIAVSPCFEERACPSGRRKARIVVADDSAVSRCLLKNILTDAGYEIAGEAADGKTAIAQYLEHRPDLITMDLTMPRMDGIEAMKAIRRSDPDARVVIITALGQKSTMLESLRNGATDYIVKPIDARRFLNAISDILNKTDSP